MAGSGGQGGSVSPLKQRKPFSLKKKKEPKRVVHGQTSGHNLCCTGLASPSLKRHGLSSQPHRRPQEPLGERATRNRGQKRAPQHRGAKSSLGRRARGRPASPARVQQGRRRQQASQSFESPQSRRSGGGGWGAPSGSEYIFWVLHTRSGSSKAPTAFLAEPKKNHPGGADGGPGLALSVALLDTRCT